MQTRTVATAGAGVMGVTLLLAALAARVPALDAWARASGWVITWGAACIIAALLVIRMVHLNGQYRAEDGPSTEAKAQRFLREQTLSHPIVVVPAIIGLACIGYILAVWPDAETTVCLLFDAAVCAVVSTGSYFWVGRRLRRRLPDLATRYALAQAEAQARVRDQRIEALRDRLAMELAAPGTLAGARETLDRLELEHELIIAALAERRESDPLSVAVLPALADETYRRGLSLVASAHDLDAAMRSLDDLSFAGARDGAKDDRVARFLAEARRCVTALGTARIELIAMRAGAPEVSGDEALTAMQQAIRQARDVQDELDAMRLVRGRASA